MKLFEVIADTEFFLFLLGAFGATVFEKIHTVLVKCHPRLFGVICVILTYLMIKFCVQ